MEDKQERVPRYEAMATASKFILESAGELENLYRLVGLLVAMHGVFEFTAEDLAAVDPGAASVKELSPGNFRLALRESE
jgi:hypothetical protein